jgi:hypothetical protein
MSRAKLSFSAERASNSELFVWALYLLGGAEHDVDVEDIYLKCFEIAPARLGWRTKPEIPDYKKTSKALQSVEAETEFIHKTHQYARRLTASGLNWVNSNLDKLKSTYGNQKVQPAASNYLLQRLTFIKSHPIWKEFKEGNITNVLHTLADSLECSPASPQQTWEGRFVELEMMSRVLNDKEIGEFLNYARLSYETEMNRVQGNE